MKMINEIYEYIGKVLIFKDKNFVFNNLHLNLDMLDVKDTSFIVFNIKYNDYFFTVKLKSVYNKLIWYIYFNNKIIAKDYCFRPSDCDRLLFLIKDNICEYELNK